MKVTFWGVRGSLPCPPPPADWRQRQRALLEEVRRRGLPSPEDVDPFLDALPAATCCWVGGNTSCVEVEAAGQTLILDAGSGIRLLGKKLMKGPCATGQGLVNLFLSHTHWDHIQGWPYFAPLYVAGNQIEVYSGFADIAERLSLQQQPEFFPVPLSASPAALSFHTLAVDQPITLKGHSETPIRLATRALNHPGEAYALRVEVNHQVVVYATDSEYSGLSHTDLDQYYQFFHQADLLIFDSQFSFHEALERRDWGHASAILGVNIAQQAQVKRLALFHHSTDYSDPTLYDLYDEAMRYNKLYFPEAQLEIFLAREGLTLEL